MQSGPVNRKETETIENRRELLKLIISNWLCEIVMLLKEFLWQDQEISEHPWEQRKARDSEEG